MLYLSYIISYISIIAMWHSSLGFTIRKMCGELECPEYYLCQSHDLQCYPCHSYCNQTSHNFDAMICERQCQDYIHDYIKHYVKAGEIQDLLRDKEIMKFMMFFVVVLLVLLIVLIVVITALIWNRKRLEWTTENEGKIAYLKRKLAFLKFKDNVVSETVDNPEALTAAQTSRTTASSSNKFPCEDITLETQDFTGYDNLGMWKVSPEFCSKL